MHTEQLAIDSSSQRHVLEEISEVVPDCDTPVLLFTFLVETIESVYLSDLTWVLPILMVAPQDGQSVRVHDFEDKDV